MATRVRLAGVIVQLQAYADDGENLELIQVQPIQTSVGEFKNLDLGEIVKSLQTQFDQQHDGEESSLDTGFS